MQHTDHTKRLALNTDGLAHQAVLAPEEVSCYLRANHSHRGVAKHLILADEITLGETVFTYGGIIGGDSGDVGSGAFALERDLTATLDDRRYSDYIRSLERIGNSFRIH